MKLLITGGAGFIGSHLSEHFINNNEIVIIDNFNDFYNTKQKENNLKNIKNNKNFKLYKIDLRNLNDIEKVFKEEKSFDYVIHLAGIAGVRSSEENPKFYYEENVMATINLSETMKKYNCKNLIYFSSSSVYGNNSNNKFSEEDSTDNPVSIYAASKKASEVLLHNYYINYDFKIVIIRPFTVYGPRQRPDLAIHLFTRNIINNKEITIYGDGSMKRDYTYISDLTDAIDKCLKYMNKRKRVYEIFNIASSNPKSIKEVINTIKEITKKDIKYKYENKAICDVNKTYGDISKANKLLKWYPKTSFKDGMKNFIDWYKENEN